MALAEPVTAPGLNVAIGPGGELVAVRLTVPEKPPTGLTAMLDVALPL
jgi:hypothetical protein